MNIDEQRIFVCEKLFGWKPPEPNQIVEGYSFQDWVDDLPPLTLDWLHECEEKLTKEQIVTYKHRLADICPANSHTIYGYWSMIHSTAEQRLAALVQTLKQSPPVSRAEQS